MKRFLYLIGFLVLLLIIKAFYLDPYLSEKFGDTNQSAEVNDSAEINTTAIDEPTVVNETNRSHQPAKQSAPKEKMPLDKVGDAIAEKLEDKIGNQ